MKFLSDSSDVSEDVLFEIKVILNELLQNAINTVIKNASKSVEVSVGITADNHVYLIVEDEGEGYDLDCVCAKEEVPEEVTDVCDLKENGRES